MVTQENAFFRKALARFPGVSSVLVITFGVLVLSGWAFHIPALKLFVPGQVAVKANTGACFVLLGIALWLVRRPELSGGAIRRYSSQFLALLVSMVGMLSLLEAWKGWDLGIDHLLFHAGAEDLLGSVRPGLMSPITGIGFCALGLAVALVHSRCRWIHGLLQSLAISVAVVSVFGVLDFVLDPSGTHTHISPATAVALFLFSFAVILSRNQWGLAALLTTSTVGGELVRRLLPACIVIPIVIGWLRWKGQFTGLFTDWTGVALMSVTTLALLGTVTIWTAFMINRADLARKQSEENLRTALLYNRSLLEASLDPLVTISKDGKITDVNRATETATGIRRDRLVGSDFSDYFSEPEKAREGYRQAFTEGFVRDYPLAIRHTSGKVMEVLYNATLFKNAKGEVDGVFAAARDVTERNQAGERLRKASLYSRSLIEASLDPLVTISKNGKIMDVNRATELATGIARERMIGSDFCDYFTEPDTARRGYETVFANEAVRDYPLAIRHISGRVTVVLYNASVFKNEAGEIEGVFAAARDVTERKRAEQALQTERQRFRDVLDKLPVYVVLLTPDYHVALDNTVFRERFGDSHGRPCYEFLFQRQAPCEICETYKVLQTGGPQQWKWTGPDGRHYEIFDFPFSDSDGSPLILEMGLDITDRKRAEEEVFRLNQELEQRVIQRTAQLEAANKELEAFTYSVSHDLRAPLRHISGFSKILTEEFASQLPVEAQHHLQRIEDGTRRMGMLVDDLLNLARVGRRDLALQVAGLKSIVEEVINALKPDVGDRQVEWEIGDLPYVECDASLMKQVFQNLLANALKFTRPRAQAVLEVGQTEKDGVPVIFVRDNGVGFSMKYADKLFGVFQRLHRTEDFEGTGVGLATVQRIIQKHGGRIWAEAELDKGATFYFTIGNAEAAEGKAETAVAGGKP